MATKGNVRNWVIYVAIYTLYLLLTYLIYIWYIWYFSLLLHNFNYTFYSQSGNYTSSISSSDFTESTSYVQHSYLKNMLVDYWTKFDTRYRVKSYLAITLSVVICCRLAELRFSSLSNFCKNLFSIYPRTSVHFLCTYWIICNKKDTM